MAVLHRFARATPDALAAWQAPRLIALMQRAAAQVPFYSALWTERGQDPHAVRGMEQWAQVPVVSHVAYRRASVESRCFPGARLEGCERRKTSGSSGIPLEVYTSRSDLIVRKTIWWRARWAAGLRPGWRQWTVGGFHAKRITPWARHWHWYAPLEAAFAQMMRGKAPDVLHGYPSALLVLMEQLREAGAPPPRLKAVTTGGETLEPALRAALSAFFSAPVHDFYGCHEAGVIAAPCAAGPGFHVASPYHFVELLRDGRPAQPGETGELVLTSLLAQPMPYVRYEVGDLAVAGTPNCPCGSPHLKIESIAGRSADVLTGPTGKTISAMFVNKPYFDRRDILQYRVTQTARDAVVVELLAHADLDAKLIADIRAFYSRELEIASVEIRRVASLEPLAGGKHKRFVALKGATS